jgi:hypothetical protein
MFALVGRRFDLVHVVRGLECSAMVPAIGNTGEECGVSHNLQFRR